MSSGFSGGLGSAGSLSGMGEGTVVGKEDVVPVGFDEAVLRALCDMDVSDRCSLPCEMSGGRAGTARRR